MEASDEEQNTRSEISIEPIDDEPTTSIISLDVEQVEKIIGKHSKQLVKRIDKIFKKAEKKRDNKDEQLYFWPCVIGAAVGSGLAYILMSSSK